MQERNRRWVLVEKSALLQQIYELDGTNGFNCCNPATSLAKMRQKHRMPLQFTQRSNTEGEVKVNSFFCGEKCDD